MKIYKIILFFLLASSIVFSQTVITKIVDPGGKGDYTSLRAWAASVQSRGSDLVARNVIEVARCICTNGEPDTYSIINGSNISFTTDATHYLKIYADTNYNGQNYRHMGYYPADTDFVYRIEYAPKTVPILGITTAKIIIDGLCIKDILPDSTYGGNGIQLVDCSEGGYITNCIIICDKTLEVPDVGAEPHGHGIRIDAVSAYSKYYIHNNIIAGFNNVLDFSASNCGILTYPTTDSLIAWVDNNTIYNCKFGIWNRGGTFIYDTVKYDSGRVYLRNNLFQNPTGDLYSAPIYVLGTSQYPVMTNNVSLANLTPSGLISNYGFEDNSLSPFENGDVTYASVSTYPTHSGTYSLYVATGWTAVNIYTGAISGLSKSTTYTLSFYAAWSMGNAYTVIVKDGDGHILGSINTPTSDSYTMINKKITFTTGTSTSIALYITGGSGGGYTFFDDFLLYQGTTMMGSSYFVNTSNYNFHLKSTATLALSQGTSLASDVNDAFTNDVDGGIRSSSWDVGADQYGAIRGLPSTDTTTNNDTTSSDTSNVKKTGATSTACVDDTTNEQRTLDLERQEGKLSFKYVEGYFTSYKVFSTNYFTFFKQNYGIFTHIIDAFGNVFMNGKCAIPMFGLPEKAVVTGTNQDTIEVATGAKFTSDTAIDNSNHSIKVNSVAGGEAAVANKIQTIMGQGYPEFYTRWKMYIPSNFQAHKTSWTSEKYAYAPFFFIADSAGSNIFQIYLKQDSTNLDNITLYVDTVSTNISISRGSTLNVQVYYRYNNTCKIWLGTTQTKTSPTYTLSYAPQTRLNNVIAYGLGWTENGISTSLYLDDFAIDSAFIPNNYTSASDGTFLWGVYDQEASSDITYGGNVPTKGLADSCLANGVKPVMSIGGWPGQYNGLDGSVGKTKWSSNTPWNYMMKDSTSSWLNNDGDTVKTGLRGHWLYNLVKLFEKKHYYGVDYDFEFIGMDTIGLDARSQSQLFPRLLEVTRMTFDTAGHKDWTISIATPEFWGPTYPDTAYSLTPNSLGHYIYTGTDPLASPADTILWGNTYQRWYDYDRIYRICDVVHVMSYGQSGIWDAKNTWSEALWKNSPNDSVGNYLNMELVDSMITVRNLPKSKTSIGLGFFGNVWLHNSDLYQDISGVYTNNSTWSTTVTLGNSDLLYPNSGSGDWTSIWNLGGVYGFCETYAQSFIKYNNASSPIEFPASGADSLSGNSIAKSSKFIITYPDSLSTILKMKWAYNKGYKGIFIWEITQDFEPVNGELRPVLEDAMSAWLEPYNKSWRKVRFIKDTSAVDTIILISPINITTNMEPFFSWHSVSGATGYDLQVAVDTNFTLPVINILNLQDTVYNSMLNALSENQNYYWRVRAKNSLSNSNWARGYFSVWSNETHPPVTQTGTITFAKNGNTYDLMIPWHVWYISDTTLKATSARIYLNGIYVGSGGDLTINSSQQQHDTVYYNAGWGNYSVTVLMLNSDGETQVTDSIFTGSSGAPMKTDKAGINILCDHPSIQIDNKGCEADVIVINKDSTYKFTFQSIGGFNPDYSVIVKDNSFFTICSISGNILTVKANRGGLTGLKIKENNNGRERYIGLAVKENGSVPKFPPYVAIGNLTQYYPESMSFYKDIKNGNADDNKRLDLGWYYYFNAYLDNGILDIYLRNSLRFGIQPMFTWYNINQGVDSPEALYNGLNDSTYLKTYFTGLKNLSQHCDSVLKGVPVNICLEPDMIGYLKNSYSSTFLLSTFNCYTSSVYSSGVLDGNDPVFANDLTGFCKSLNYIIKKYCPNAVTGWAFPLWAASHNSGKGIMHATDSDYGTGGGSYSVGRATIATDFNELGLISITLGLDYMTDYMNIEGWGYDGAINLGPPIDSTNWTNPSQTAWFWNAQHWDNLIYAAGTIHSVINLPIILNGNSGHINHSLAQSPTIYNSTNTFPDLVDTSYSYEDSAPDYFFGDTITVTGTNRLSHFSIIPQNDPYGVVVNGSTVIWKEHITKAKDNGVIGISFGPGMGIDTHNTPDPNISPLNKPSDNYWWMVKAQRYYQNPVMK